MAKAGAGTEFGEVLKSLRINSGFSQESLAERARMSPSTISALERGVRRAPYRETVELLAVALALSASERATLEAAAERARGRRSSGPEVRLANNNLPARLTSFIGRDREIDEIGALLHSQRLVTVTGSGGVGKTRVAVEIARRQLDEEEVWFVDLSPVAEETFVVPTIASVLHVPLAHAADPELALAAGLKGRSLLLVLDNCEHLIGAVARIVSVMLQASPKITVLATSRERLAIAGEHVYRLPSLNIPANVPATTDEALANDSVRLFMERATAIDGGLTLGRERLGTLTEICRQLEGIPLAIELAATRLPMLGFTALNERLKDHFAISSGQRDLPQRQQTLLATIAWSYDLLSEPERIVIRRLAVFSGGAAIDLATQVCAGDGISESGVIELISSLVDKSLLSMNLVDDRSRYVMLESVRAFARAKLTEAGELMPVSRAHASRLAEVGDRAFARFAEVQPTQWLHEFRAELDNVRTALKWALESSAGGDAMLAARLVTGFRMMWALNERPAECRRWAAATLERVDEEAHPLAAARLMSTIVHTSDGRPLLAAAARVLPLYERLGDRIGIVGIHGNVAREHVLEGAFDEATRSIGHAFALIDETDPQDVRWCIQLLQLRCFINIYVGRIEEARSDFARKVTIELGLAEAPSLAHFYLEGLLEFAEGNARRAADLLETCAERAVSSAIGHATPLCDLAAVRLVLGEVDAAAGAAHQALELARFEELGLAWKAIQHLAVLSALRGNPSPAARLSGFVDAWCTDHYRARGPYEAATHALLTASLQAQLSGAAIATLAAEGETFDFTRAADEALQLT
jgi:predicted ATPase/DNA-binding XRE family transcriptional regulator